MKKFSIGYDGNQKDLEKLLPYGNHLESLYTGGMPEMVRGGRPQYSNSLADLEPQIKEVHRAGIQFEIALNAPCGIESRSNKIWWRKIYDYFYRIEDMGVDGVIVSHPFLIEEIKQKTKMKVILSTICEVMTVRSAKYYEDIGADVIVPSMNLNFNPQLLNEMFLSLKKAKLRIMLNESCLKDCPWRRFHHNHYAHSDNEYEYHKKCKSVIFNEPFLLLTNNTIRPEDLKNYLTITNSFKIVGRLVPVELTVERLCFYIEESYSGNYVRLFDWGLSKKYTIENSGLGEIFFWKTSCNNLCENCGRCQELWRLKGAINQNLITEKGEKQDES